MNHAMHSAAFLLLYNYRGKKAARASKSSTGAELPVILVVTGNAIKPFSAEIVAVLRTHEGAAVVGGMKSSNLQQRSRFPSVSRSNLKVIQQQSPTSTTHVANVASSEQR